MTKRQMKNLQNGDIVQSKATGDAYIVTDNFGSRVTAVRSADITNPDEWEVSYDARAKDARNRLQSRSQGIAR